MNAKGSEKSILADNVIIEAGRKPRQEEALKFHGSAKRFFIIGDCSNDGDIMKLRKGYLIEKKYIAVKDKNGKILYYLCLEGYKKK